MPLRRKAPAPPTDLLARCLSTIPGVAGSPARSRLLPDAASRRRLLVFGAAAGVCGAACVAVPLLRGVLVARPAAKHEEAQPTPAVDAQQRKVTFVRIFSRTRLFTEKDGGFRYLGRWQHDTQFLDVERGVYSHTAWGGERQGSILPSAPGANAYLRLADGRIMTRIGARMLTRSARSASDFQEERRRLLALVGSPITAAAQVGGLSGMGRRDVVWMGRAAQQLLFSSRSDRNLAKSKISNAPMHRNEWYVDKQNGRLLAVRRYACWVKNGKLGPEVLVGSADYEYYLRRPEQHDRFFDPEWFARGVTKAEPDAG